MSDSKDIRWKLFAGISVIGFVLLFFLGYNLGSLNEESRASSIQAKLNKAHELAKGRMMRCKKANQDLKKGIRAKNSDLHVVNQDLEALQMENEMFEETEKDLEEGLADCRTLVVKTQNSEQNLAKTIEDYQRKIVELELLVGSSDSSQAMEVKVMKGQIRALRLENEALRIRKLQRDQIISRKKKEVEEWNRKKEEESKRKELENLDAEIKKSQEVLVNELKDKTTEKEEEDRKVSVVTSEARVDRRRARYEEENDDEPVRRVRSRARDDEDVAPPPRRRYVTEDDRESNRKEESKRRYKEDDYEPVRVRRARDFEEVPKRRIVEDQFDELEEKPTRPRRIRSDVEEEADLRRA